MNLEVQKEDIKLIGHTVHEHKGNTAFICNGDTYNIEKIFLRNILKCFGDEFTIVSEEDYNGYDDYDILCITNLPFEIYNGV